MSPDPSWPWAVLGLPAMPKETTDIRRAYAKALKQIDQTTDIAGFANLRFAYEQALIIRERRNAQNTAKRARKAVVVEKDLPRTDDSFHPPEAIDPVLSAAQIAANKKNTDLTDLLIFIVTAKTSADLGKRIADTLANPLSTDPDCAPQIRAALASLLRNAIVSDEYNEPALPAEWTADTLFALDGRYGWLNDYTAFRQDFWGNTDLQDLMATRAYKKISSHRPPAQKGRHRIKSFGRSIYQLFPLMGFLIYFNVVKILFIPQGKLAANTGHKWHFAIALVLVLVPLLWFTPQVMRSIWRDFYSLPGKLTKKLNRMQLLLSRIRSSRSKNKR